MDFSVLDLSFGLVLSSIVAGAAYYKKSLSPSGFYAAVILGSLIFSLGGILFWSILILFFISSSLLSKFKRQSKLEMEADFAKTGRRDWLQVVANGSVGLGFALAWSLSGNHLFILGFIAAFATVNADTWATEIGILSKKSPVSILTLRPVLPGVSGAVSTLGSGAALAGSSFIALLACLGLALSDPGNLNLFWVFVAGTMGGVFGCLVDSLLGATIQVMYQCQVCGKMTERTVHHNKPTLRVRGLKFFANDMVNLTSSLSGGVLAMVIFYFLN